MLIAVTNLFPKKLIKIIAIFVIALELRTWGINFGLPLLFHQDEQLILKLVINNFLNGNLNPGWFEYPSLFMYLIFIPIQISFSFGETNLSNIFLIARWCSAIFGAATVPLVYYTGKKIFNQKVGWLVAIFTCFLPIHIKHSHYATVDVTLGFLILLAIYFLALAEETKLLRYIYIAALVTGLAASVKYTGIFVILPTIGWVVWQDYSQGKISKNTIRMVVYLVGIAGVAFIIGTPYSILDMPSFLRGLYIQSKHSKEGHFGAESTNIFYLIFNDDARNSLWGSIDIVTFGLTLLGVGYGVWRSIKYRLFMDVSSTLLIIGSYLFLSGWKTKFVRWLIPFIPISLIWGSDFIEKSLTRVYIKPVKIFCLTLILIIPIVSSVWEAKAFSTTDTRTLATDWVKTNVTKGSNLCLDKNTIYVDSSYGSFKTLEIDPAVAPPYRITMNPANIKECDYVANSSYFKMQFYKKETIKLRPEKAEIGQKFYKSLEKEGKLLKHFSPSDRKYVGPEIKIYQVQKK